MVFIEPKLTKQTLRKIKQLLFRVTVSVTRLLINTFEIDIFRAVFISLYCVYHEITKSKKMKMFPVLQ